ncbi:MAG: hypothetical protein V8S90_04980 [Lachnospiraceae bacterium]
MTNLLVFREQLKKFYSKYELYITPLCKFLLALVSLMVINSRIGYMSTLKNAAVVLILALLCSFLPINLTIVIAAAVTLAHLYAFSVECAIVALAVFLLLFILYFRFSPKDTLAVLLTPICFVLKIPYVMPIAVGLIGTPASSVAVASGVIVYYMLAGMNESASVLNTFDADGMVDKFRYCIDTLMGNRAMMVAIVAFAATVLVVWFIRRLSIDHAWTIAMITGALLNILILLFGDLMYSTDISIIGLILGSIVSVLLVKVLQFFVFNVDYSRTEMVQFEDDEYYYYVKAVPKNTVATPEKRVKTIRVPEKAVNRSRRDTGRQ